MSYTTLGTSISYVGAVPSEAKWSLRATLLFIVGSSLALWSLIIAAAVQLA